jgi:virginiamycin B lyase
MKIRAAVAELRFDLGDCKPLYVAIGNKQSIWVTCAATREVVGLMRTGYVDRYVVQSTPHQIALGGKSVWFTMPHIDSVGRIDQRGKAHTYKLPDGSQPTGIAANADGAWLTLRGTGELASVSSSGDVQVMSTGIDYDNQTLLAMRGTPSQIAIDETDGSVWFTLTGLAEVGHRFARGAAKYWSDDDCVEPTGIAMDPRTVWITDFGGGGIWRVRRANPRLERVDVWPAGTSVDIATDGIGGCWFTQVDENVIAHCSDDGAFTQYDLTPYGRRPRGLAVDNKGVAWVAMASGAIVGVIGRPI